MTTVQLGRSGLLLAVIAVSFTVFRGTTNIFNAILVPLSLDLALHDTCRKDKVTTVVASLMLIGILFRQQLAFLIIYVVIYLLMEHLQRSSLHLGVKLPVLSVAAATGFGMAAWLTDFLFLTNINAMLLGIAQGNLVRFALILLLQGVVVAACLFSIQPIFQKALGAHVQQTP